MDVCDELRHRLPGLLSAFAVLDPFWRPVVRGIMQEIRGTACIQTESLSWVRPEEAILRPSSVGESLVSNHCLQSACDGLEFVADSMREMAETLGCAELGLEHMIAVAHHISVLRGGLCSSNPQRSPPSASCTLSKTQ